MIVIYSRLSANNDFSPQDTLLQMRYTIQVLPLSISDSYPRIEKVLVIVLFQLWCLTLTSQREVHPFTMNKRSLLLFPK